MPIIRTYGCPECSYVMDVVLDASQWDDPPPSCPKCDERDVEKAQEMQQHFKPPAIGGSNRSKAVRLAEQIASEDYGVANFQAEGKQGHPAKVRYKDQSDQVQRGVWTGPNAAAYQVSQQTLETAVKLGRENRLKHGNGLDILQSTLKSGDMPDLIEVSKKRSTRIW